MSVSWKTQQWPQDWKRSALIPLWKKSNVKECPYYCIIVLISRASKVMLKSLQAWLQQNVSQEFPDTQIGFRKGRRTRDEIANIHRIKKQENSRKNICFIDYTKTFVQIRKKLWKILKEMGIQDHLTW